MPRRVGLRSFGTGARAIEEVLLIERTVEADPRLHETLRRRGLLDELEHLCVDPNADGIATSVEQDRPLVNADLVLWHTFGLHRLAQPENQIGTGSPGLPASSGPQASSGP